MRESRQGGGASRAGEAKSGYLTALKECAAEFMGGFKPLLEMLRYRIGSSVSIDLAGGSRA
jgi:hypothetical protein